MPVHTLLPAIGAAQRSIRGIPYIHPMLRRSFAALQSDGSIVMIHAVTKENATYYEKEKEESFCLRHKIFVEEKNWSDLTRSDGREIDQFDNDDAIYLFALEKPSRKVIGGCRLLSTTAPYLLTDVFPNLCTKPIPRDPKIFEWGRMHVSPSQREGGAMSPTSCHIMAATVEFCLEQGIEQLVLVSEAYWLPRFMGLGLKPNLLGLPEVIEGAPTVAYTLAPSADALFRIRNVHGFRTPSLVTRGMIRSVNPQSSIAG
jgi:acyl-homoserine lactone synthase